MKTCQPNPCKHGGKCTIVTSSQFSCDCSSTGYQGKTCERGVIDKPDFPTIIAGVPTNSLKFRASPPDDYIILTPTSQFIKFNPPSLFFKQYASTPQSFTMTARRPGLHFVKFTLAGPGAAAYETPGSVVFFVQSVGTVVNTKKKDLKFPSGRCTIELDKCPSSGVTISAYSTSPWRMFGPTAITYGQVSLKTGSIEIAHSVTGGNFAAKKHSGWNPRCATNPLDTYSLTELSRRKVLAKSFLSTVRHSLPKWLDIKLHDSLPLNSMLETDLRANYLSGKHLGEEAAFKELLISRDTFFSLLSSPDIDVIIHGDRVSFGKSDRSARFAVAIELCGSSPNDVILRPSPVTKHILNHFPVMKQLQDKGWKFKIDSLRISNTLFGQTTTNKTLTMSARFNKQFKLSNNFKSRVNFEGTVIINVDNLDNVCENLFEFLISFKYFAKQGNVNFLKLF